MYARHVIMFNINKINSCLMLMLTYITYMQVIGLGFRLSLTTVFYCTLARSQKILSEVLFLVDEGSEDLNTTISGPSSARQRNAI